MSSLPTLIKLQKHKVEGIQKYISQTRTELAEVEQNLTNLEAELLRGAEVAAQLEDPAVFAQAAQFVKMAKKKKDILLQRKTEWEQLLTKQLEALNTEFQAQKRYETLHQRKEAEAKRTREAKIQKGLDEAASASWQAME